MKFQTLVSLLLPALAPLIAALPAADVGPGLVPVRPNFTAALLEAVPDLTSDDEETPANIARDELIEAGASSSSAVADIEKRAAAVPSLTWDDLEFSFIRRRLFRKRKVAEGNARITFWRNGNVRFRTHFKALRVLNYNYAVTCAVRDAAGNAYTLSRKGKICGALGSCGTAHDVDETKHSAQVQRNWQSIKSGNKKIECQARLKWDFTGLFDSVMRLIEKAGKITGIVIKVFGI